MIQAMMRVKLQKTQYFKVNHLSKFHRPQIAGTIKLLTCDMIMTSQHITYVTKNSRTGPLMSLPKRGCMALFQDHNAMPQTSPQSDQALLEGRIVEVSVQLLVEAKTLTSILQRCKTQRKIVDRLELLIGNSLFQRCSTLQVRYLKWRRIQE